MPGLKTQNLPASDRSNPYGILMGTLKNLQGSFKEREKTLRAYNLSPDEFNGHLARIQSEYDEEKLRLTQIKSQLDTIQTGINSGTIGPDAGIKSMYSLVVPRETISAMFPEPEPEQQVRRPFTTGNLDEIYQSAKTVAEMAPTVEQGWIKKPFTEEGLVNQYATFRRKHGYNALTKEEKDQLEITWDTLMQSDSRYKNWNPENKSVLALRATGKSRMMDQAAQKILPKRKMPAALRLVGLSPMGAAIAYHGMNKQIKNSQQNLPRPTTAEEHAALPSGTQYIGTDGKIRVKK